MLQRKILVGLAVAGFVSTAAMAVLHPMQTVQPPAPPQAHVQLTAAECAEFGQLARELQTIDAENTRLEAQQRNHVIGYVLSGPYGWLTAVALNTQAQREYSRTVHALLDDVAEDCQDTPTSP